MRMRTSEGKLDVEQVADLLPPDGSRIDERRLIGLIEAAIPASVNQYGEEVVTGTTHLDVLAVIVHAANTGLIRRWQEGSSNYFVSRP
jgi:hypothetical protein